MQPHNVIALTTWSDKDRAIVTATGILNTEE